MKNSTTPLLNTIPKQHIEHNEVKLVLSWHLHPYRLVFVGLKGRLHATSKERLQILRSTKVTCLHDALEQQWHKRFLRVTKALSDWIKGSLHEMGPMSSTLLVTKNLRTD